MSDGKRPLRVLVSADTFPPDINGASRFAERLVGGLARRGNDVHVIAPGYNKKWGSSFETIDGSRVMVHRLKSYKLPQHETLRWVWPFTLRGRISKLLDRIQPDVIHINSHLITGRFLISAAKRRGVRTVSTNHIMPENLVKYSVIIPPFLEQWAMNLAWKDAGRILRKVDQLTTPTRRAAELLEAAAGVNNVLAISCGIDASKFANDAPTTNEHPRILYLGRLDYEKHIHNLLKAVALLPKELGTVVELVGDGGERENLKQLARDLRIYEQVIFAGHISEADLPKAYERCTVFAMPSIAELQSIATMEAMASGRPVVAADAMALPHLVHDGDNGYLFAPDDVEDFAKKLQIVLTANQKELDRLSENSLHLIQAHDIQRTLGIFEQIYRGEYNFGDPTSDDNAPEYSQPIGSLSRGYHNQVEALRKRAKALRELADDLRDNVREQLDEAREEVLETVDEIRAGAKKLDKKVRKTVKKATDKLKRD
ncbi:MAG: glycosyltransferase [Micrococcales bacterium]